MRSFFSSKPSRPSVAASSSAPLSQPTASPDITGVDTFAPATHSSPSRATAAVPPSIALPETTTPHQPVILKDNTIHEQFKGAGVDLTSLWDRLLDAIDARGFQDAILDAAEANQEAPGSAQLPSNISTTLDAELQTIQAAIQSNPLLAPELKEAVARYFTLASYQARLNGGDEYLLSAPATPVKLITAADGTLRCQTFENIPQSSPGFELLNPSADIATDPELTIPWLGAKKLLINYLQISTKVLPVINAISEGAPQASNLESDSPPEKNGENGQKDIRVRGEDTLKAMDNRQFMRTERDHQGGHGYCWSFASSRLAEEQVCKHDPNSPDCKSQISPLDTSYDHWRFAHKSEGGHISDGLQNTIDHGVCLNAKAPYPGDPQEHQIVDHINDYFKALRDSTDTVNNKDWKSLNVISYDPRGPGLQTHRLTLDDALLNAVETVHQQSLSWWRFWQWPLQLDWWDNPLGESLQNTISTLSWADSKVSEAVRDTLVGKDCLENRIKSPFQSLSHHEDRFLFNSRESRLDALKKALESGNSVGVGMCVARQMGQPGCGPHAIVMDAARYDEKRDQWEGHFINSWGEDSKVMNGWRDLGDVVDDLLALNYYVPKTNEA
jgi:hypothetical protein